MNQLSRYSIILIATLAASAVLAATSTVTAPPLPPGFHKVNIQPGQNPKEKTRDKHAHKRPKKDKTRDDTRATATTTADTAAAAATLAPAK